jgi:hypothetical protein
MQSQSKENNKKIIPNFKNKPSQKNLTTKEIFNSKALKALCEGFCF